MQSAARAFAPAPIHGPAAILGSPRVILGSMARWRIRAGWLRLPSLSVGPAVCRGGIPVFAGPPSPSCQTHNPGARYTPPPSPLTIQRPASRRRAIVTHRDRGWRRGHSLRATFTRQVPPQLPQHKARAAVLALRGVLTNMAIRRVVRSTYYSHAEEAARHLGACGRRARTGPC